MSQALIVSQTVHYHNETLNKITTTWSNGNVNNRYVYIDRDDQFPEEAGGAFNEKAVIGKRIGFGLVIVPFLAYVAAVEYIKAFFEKKKD